MKKSRIISILLVLLQVVCVFSIPVSAQESEIEPHPFIHTDNALEAGLSYLGNAQDECGAWGDTI